MISKRGCRKLVTALLCTYIIITLTVATDDDNCKAELDFINILMDRCVTVKFGARDDECLASIEPFEMYICNDRKYTFTIDQVQQLNPRVIFSLSYCKPYCIITTNVSNVCHFYNYTKTENNLRNHQYVVCINNSNYSDCLPSIGRNASCWPQVEQRVDKDGRSNLCPPSESITTCLKYRDPACFEAITIDSMLILLCSYSLLQHTETVDSSISPIVMHLRDQASAECLELLNNNCRTLTVIESTIILHDSESQECLKNYSDMSLPCSSEQKGAPSRRTRVSVEFSERLITFTNYCSATIDDIVCVSNSDPELRNIDPLRLRILSNDPGLVIEPSNLTLLISTPMNCVSLTFTIDTCDVKNISVFVESVEDNGNLEYHIVYNNNLTLQITKSSDTSNTNTKRIIKAVMVSSVLILLLVIISIALYYRRYILKKFSSLKRYVTGKMTSP